MEKDKKEEGAPQGEKGAVLQKDVSIQEGETDAEKEELKRQLAESLKSINTLQRNLSKKDEQLKRPKTPQVTPTGGEDAFTDAIVKAVNEGNTDALIRAAQERKQQIAIQKQQDEFYGYVDSEEEKILTQIRTAGGDPDTDEFEEVRDWIEVGKKTGDFSRASYKVTKALGKMKPKSEKAEEKKGDTEAEIEKRVEEGIRQRMEGKLGSDTGSPSAGTGGVYTYKQIRDMDPKLFAETFGGKSLLQLEVEGKIKEK